MSKTLPYRLGVGIMLVNRKGQVFVAKRIDTTSEAWQMPQGGMEPQEEPFEAAKRELLEETGIAHTVLLYESKDWYAYDLPEHLVPKLWGGRYRGQQQKWFLLRFDGVESDINIATESPEFNEWKWSKPEALPELIVPFKRDMYQALVDEFLPVIHATCA